VRFSPVLTSRQSAIAAARTESAIFRMTTRHRSTKKQQHHQTGENRTQENPS